MIQYKKTLANGFLYYFEFYCFKSLIRSQKFTINLHIFFHNYDIYAATQFAGDYQIIVLLNCKLFNNIQLPPNTSENIV